ncbi:hypothetical protein FRB95_001001 [Tulasnella sp. JGI-2019a]|nr:hypothetical protein FRB95_001001 [Tulasnella sp. JGI-2019a]
MYHALGVRYMTLTHICHNAFADSGGYLKPSPPNHYGLSDFGRVLIKEMNRLGVIVDLSHTSDETARQAFELSEAPVMWSHSSARAVWNFAELYRRGWKTKDLEGLAGGNVLRVYKGAERVSKTIQARGVAPYADIYRARKDL